MERLRLYFLLLSLALAGLTVFLIVRENRSAWQPYQEEYQQYLIDNAATEAEMEAAGRFSIAVKQDWLPAMERADRCRTCHVGVDNPKAPVQEPLAAHPEIGPHPFNRFGCTVCHEGDGYATRLPDAHERMVPTPALEASCGKCHDSEDLKIDAPTYEAGSHVVDRFNCAGCHQFGDRPRKEFAGPGLDGLGAKVSDKWLIAWLKNPKQYLAEPRMGDFLLTGDESSALAEYLLNGNNPPPNFTNLIDGEAEQAFVDEMSDDDYYALIDEGKTLFGRLRCLSCHKLKGRGGKLGPELGRIAMKTNRAWLSNWLAAPSAYDKHTIMPVFNLNQRERISLVSYLLDESEYYEKEEEAAAETEAAGQKKPGYGARLFVERGCYNCHELAGVKGSNEFAPVLAAFADKKVEKIDFGKSSVPHNLADYVAAKLQSPRLFGKNLKMPDFGLKQEQVGRLATVVLAQSREIPPEMQKRPTEAAGNILPAGEAGRLFDRYKCLNCHMINGAGGSLAPDLSHEGSKVNRQWLIDYLLKPYAIRPFLEERMLRFNMEESEAVVLAQYIDLVFRNREIDAVDLPRQGDAATGKKLYFETYRCRDCHALGKGGGYFGPALDTVGDRLQPAWIDARLQNAHQFEPDSREPVLNIPAAERADLAAFLQTLRQGEETL